MPTYYAGCDVGSTTGKAVILNGESIAASAIIKSMIDPAETARAVLRAALDKISDSPEVESLDYLVGTGYGRTEVPFANENLSEISCHALGAHFVDSEVRTIIDIGGQDVKSIAVASDGSVKEFAMNEKCAAGTGRFFEMMSRLFDLDLDGFSDLSLQAKRIVPVTSQCSVFAETEVVSLISKRKPPADIAAGIQMAVAKRVFTLARKVGLKDKVTVTGGCARNRGLVQALEKILRVKIVPLEVDAQLMGALGAAITARRKA